MAKLEVSANFYYIKGKVIASSIEKYFKDTILKTDEFSQPLDALKIDNKKNRMTTISNLVTL